MRTTLCTGISSCSRLSVAALFVVMTLGCVPHTAHAVTYDFNADTIGSTPANTTVGAGTFDVQDQATLGYSLRAVTQVGVIAAINFTSFASTTDQSVVWKQAYSNSLGRSGFTLRAQSEDTNTVNSAGAKQGYLFHVYENTAYIWRVGASGYTSLWSGSLSKAQPRWFKAIAQGTGLGFYYSDDGATYTKLGSTTDSTYTAGKVQYTAGYGSSVDRDYVDDIVITNLGTPDTTAPSVTLVAPVASGTVGGSSVALSATASDDSGLAGVKFYVDGVLQGSEDTTSSYGVVWNSTATTSGTHTAFAVARDTSNNYATSSSISFTVDNTTPVLSVAAAGTTNTGVRLSWTSNEAASSRVNLGLTSSYGSSTPEMDTSPRVTSHVVDISGLVSCTRYHYQLQSTDAVGNIGTSSTDATFITSGCEGGTQVASTTVSTITTASGGTKSLVQGNMTLDVTVPVASTATTSSFTIQIKSLDGIGTLGTPSGSLQTVTDSVFDVKALINATTTLDSFNSPVTITARYAASSVSGLAVSSLRMYHYHAGAWSMLDNCATDSSAMTVTCTTPNFSIFALFGSAESSATPSRKKTTATITAQVNTLIAMGKVAEATAVKAAWPSLYSKVSSVATSTAPSARDMYVGSVGDDVRKLQQFLNASGFAIAQAGAGSLGNETRVFGSLTKASLAKYQKAHGISPASGFFGPKTRALMNI